MVEGEEDKAKQRLRGLFFQSLLIDFDHLMVKAQLVDRSDPNADVL